MSVLLLLDTYLYLLTSKRSVWRRADLKLVYYCCPRNCSISVKIKQCKQLQGKAEQRRYIHTHNQTSAYSKNFRLGTASSKAFSIAKKSMSRIKNTFDSVTKAVSNTHSELISRIVRPKPNPASVGKAENVRKAEVNGTQGDFTETKAEENGKEPLITSRETTSNLNQNSPDSTDSRANLFHPSSLTTNFGETYNFLANHINSYFAHETGMEKNNNKTSVDAKSQIIEIIGDKEKDASSTTEDATVSTKKSISNFLSNQSNNVHAFVGSYLGGLVPKLKTEQKNMIEEKGKEQDDEDTQSKNEQEVTKEKTVDDKAKRLSLQREKIIARVSVDNRTRSLVQSLQRSSDRRLCINRVEELSCHLLEFPETRGVAVKEKAIPYLLRLRQAHDETLQAAVREALALIGYTDPVKGRGIRVLTIDGGGTRGIVALQTLRKLEELTGKPVHLLFDYICGVSTGAILAFMLGLFHIPLDECEEMYQKLGTDVFKQNVIVGTMKMGWSHAYYDSEIWEKMLKERMGSDLMIETARNPLCPKVAAVSAIVNRGIPLKPFVFRNYNHFPGVKSHYMGGCQYNLWQAIRASSAAPGYFQEYVLGNDLHQVIVTSLQNICCFLFVSIPQVVPSAVSQRSVCAKFTALCPKGV
uniref:PNPLA domain-containing protein n=1 Tax=Pyxicephalus adspersus TaxID=30357 RepID=A0AAV3AID0_PYXAD|nr:TPA: hypothetical protein GDO54_007084 [Pyxicephalus adspersus]